MTSGDVVERPNIWINYWKSCNNCHAREVARRQAKVSSSSRMSSMPLTSPAAGLPSTALYDSRVESFEDYIRRLPMPPRPVPDYHFPQVPEMVEPDVDMSVDYMNIDSVLKSRPTSGVNDSAGYMDIDFVDRSKAPFGVGIVPDNIYTPPPFFEVPLGQEKFVINLIEDEDEDDDDDEELDELVARCFTAVVQSSDNTPEEVNNTPASPMPGPILLTSAFDNISQSLPVDILNHTGPTSCEFTSSQRATSLITNYARAARLFQLSRRWQLNPQTSNAYRKTFFREVVLLQKVVKDKGLTPWEPLQTWFAEYNTKATPIPADNTKQYQLHRALSLSLSKTAHSGLWATVSSRLWTCSESSKLLSMRLV